MFHLRYPDSPTRVTLGRRGRSGTRFMDLVVSKGGLGPWWMSRVYLEKGVSLYGGHQCEELTSPSTLHRQTFPRSTLIHIHTSIDVRTYTLGINTLHFGPTLVLTTLDVLFSVPGWERFGTERPNPKVLQIL